MNCLKDSDSSDVMCTQLKEIEQQNFNFTKRIHDSLDLTKQCDRYQDKLK